jgi:sigma-B regulation protein RsbU (phosphoserine phosphatase)
MAYKILIVDDDSVTRDLLKLYLTRWGYECTVAINGIHAWELFQKDHFDIVLTDWIMPGLQGTELCEKIKNSTKKGYTYTILCTIKDNVQNVVEGIESGADDYIPKPFDHNELKVRIAAGERILKLERSLEEKNQRIDRNLKQAAISLESMLPIRRKGSILNIDWFFKPAAYIGGDVFNIFNIDDDHCIMFSIDVSGHGIASALFAVTLSNMLSPWMTSSEAGLSRSRLVIENLFEPAAVASDLNNRFQLEPPSDLYFTMFYAIYSKKDGSLRWIRAGHPPPIIINNDKLVVLREGDPPIGFLPGYKFTQYQCKLEKNDRLFLYTDGITEATDKAAVPFGIERLINELRLNFNNPLKATIQNLEHTILNYRGNDEFDDDISLLGLEII